MFTNIVRVRELHHCWGAALKPAASSSRLKLKPAVPLQTIHTETTGISLWSCAEMRNLPHKHLSNTGTKLCSVFLSLFHPSFFDCGLNRCSLTCIRSFPPSWRFSLNAVNFADAARRWQIFNICIFLFVISHANTLVWLQQTHFCLYCKCVSFKQVWDLSASVLTGRVSSVSERTRFVFFSFYLPIVFILCSSLGCS